MPRSPEYSDLDLSRWKEYLPDIETGSLWQFPSRDKSGTHMGDYHGNFVPQVAQQLMKRFTRRGDLVIDLFSGMGTTMIECRRLGRNGIGVELLPEVADRSQERIAATANPDAVVTDIIRGSSRDEAVLGQVDERIRSMDRRHADLLVLHPPYSDIIRFSGGVHPDDLSTVESDEQFLDRFAQVVALSYPLLGSGKHMGLVIGDKYAGGAWIPLGFRCMERCMQAGYVLKSIVVKDIQGNERGKGRNGNLWKYRALAGGFYLFKHEYVMIFRKP